MDNQLSPPPGSTHEHYGDTFRKRYKINKEEEKNSNK